MQHLFSMSKTELSMLSIILLVICFQKYPPFDLAFEATKLLLFFVVVGGVAVLSITQVTNILLQTQIRHDKLYVLR